MAHQHAFARASHARHAIVVLEPLQARQHRRVLLRLRLLGAERVIGERVEADCRRLLRGEVFREQGPMLLLKWVD